MRTLVIGLATALMAIIGWSISMATDKPPRKFGPEWKLDKDGGNYHRKVEIEQSHSVGGNVGGYTVPLENDSVNVIEIDNDAGFDLNCKYGRLRVSKNKKGGNRSPLFRLKTKAFSSQFCLFDTFQRRICIHCLQKTLENGPKKR